MRVVHGVFYFKSEAEAQEFIDGYGLKDRTLCRFEHGIAIQAARGSYASVRGPGWFPSPAEAAREKRDVRQRITYLEWLRDKHPAQFDHEMTEELEVLQRIPA